MVFSVCVLTLPITTYLDVFARLSRTRLWSIQPRLQDLIGMFRANQCEEAPGQADRVPRCLLIEEVYSKTAINGSIVGPSVPAELHTALLFVPCLPFTTDVQISRYHGSFR